MISDDEFLERIVAGIHAATSDGANVSWNEKINGRQFDVVVRFRLGTLDYLVLVEVKNRSRPASADDVGAFVVKANDQGASKAVFVTAAGFQSGALEVGRRHGVDLFTVSFDASEPALPGAGTFVAYRQAGAAVGPESMPTLTLEEPNLVAAIEKAVLIYADGSSAKLPDEQSQMTYYASSTMLSDGRKLADLMRSAPLFALMLGETKMQRLAVQNGITVTPPDRYFFPAGEIAAIEMTLVGRMGRRLSGSVRIEPSMFRGKVIYSNMITGESYDFSFEQLPLNTAGVMAGRFYFLVHPLRYYHCAHVSAGIVRWEMIESFQNEQLIQLTFNQKAKFGAFYIPVSDKRIIERLQRRLDDYRDPTLKKLSRRGFRQLPRNGATKRKSKRR